MAVSAAKVAVSALFRNASNPVKMATRGVALIVTYVAYNISTGAYVTGDVANHTLRWIKDGTASAPTNAASEVDATNAPGEYKVTLTATETDCGFGTLAGKSSTGSVIVLPTSIAFVYLPNATPGALAGLPTADASNRVKANLTAVNTHTVTDTVSGVPDVNAGYIGGSVSAGAAGKVALDMAYAVPTSNAAETVGDCLIAARAQGFGKWVLSGTTLTIYAANGTTALRTFTLDSGTAPTTRT